MIFNENMDKSLFLILKNDKKNRNDIIRLLKFIPNELYSCMVNLLNSYDEVCPNESIKENNDDNIKFKFKYGVVDGLDNITLNMEDLSTNEEFELSLSSCNFSEDNIELGYFSKTNKKSKDNKRVENKRKYQYSVYNLPKEQLFIRIKDTKKLISGLPIITDFKEEKIPNDLTLKYINNKFDKRKKKLK